jgi:hypothetical protein
MIGSVFEDSAGGEIVEAVCDVGQAIGHDLGVGPTVAGIHAMAGFHVAERFEGRIRVIENLDKHLPQFAGFRCGG